MRPLDHAKLCGFEFQRSSPGEDGPLVGHRVRDNWVDIIHIEGFKIVQREAVVRKVSPRSPNYPRSAGQRCHGRQMTGRFEALPQCRAVPAAFHTPPVRFGQQSLYPLPKRPQFAARGVGLLGRRLRSADAK
jgi:hypothetical protein